jgi:hypothetical protein
MSVSSTLAPHPLAPSPTPLRFVERGNRAYSEENSPSPRSGEAAKLERGLGGEVLKRRQILFNTLVG